MYYRPSSINDSSEYTMPQSPNCLFLWTETTKIEILFTEELGQQPLIHDGQNKNVQIQPCFWIQSGDLVSFCWRIDNEYSQNLRHIFFSCGEYNFITWRLLDCRPTIFRSRIFRSLGCLLHTTFAYSKLATWVYYSVNILAGSNCRKSTSSCIIL